MVDNLDGWSAATVAAAPACGACGDDVVKMVAVVIEGIKKRRGF
jgi:hypothetical protein